MKAKNCSLFLFIFMFGTHCLTFATDYINLNDNNLANVIAEIRLWDEDKNSLLWQLHKHVTDGNTIALKDAVLETLAHAENVVEKKSKQLSSDALYQINDALDQMADMIKCGKLDVNKENALHAIVQQKPSCDTCSFFCEKPICPKEGPRGPRGHRGHRGATGPTGADGSTVTGANVGAGTGLIFRDKTGIFINFKSLIQGSFLTITNNTSDITLDVNGTNLNIPNTLVARDNTGSFSAQVISMVDGVVSENIIFSTEPSTATAGNVIKGSSRFIHDFGTNNTFVGIDAGNFTLTGTQNSGFGANALSALTSGSGNTAIGYNTLPLTTSGSNNTAVGDALSANVTGNNNTALGANTLNANTESANTAVGANALAANTTGINNTAMGYNALTTAQGTFENVAIGNGAMQFAVPIDSINLASSNIAIGFNALQNTNSGNDVQHSFAQPCIAIGSFALQNNTTGYQNIAIGQYALHSNIAGAGDIAIGTNALASNVGNVDGSDNVAVGDYALASNTEGAENVAIGTNALTANITGNDNIAIGKIALFRNTIGSRNVAVGRAALLSNINGEDNTAIGDSALEFNTSGTFNTSVGSTSMEQNTTGFNNTAVGYAALIGCVTGHDNVGIGFNAFATGNFNTIVGSEAGQDGSQNTAVGYAVLIANESDRNTGVGYQALSNRVGPGPDNTAIGWQALQNTTPSGANTSQLNTAVGRAALMSLSSGNSNIAVGANAGTALTSSESNDIYIGNVGVVGESAAIRIGTLGTHTTCFVQGINGVTTGGVAVPVLVDASGQLGTISSSRRFKHDIQSMGNDSASIYQLNPVTFMYNSDESETKQYGLIAEEVAEVFPGIVVNDENGQPFTVQYHVLPVLLLNELKKQKTEFTSEIERITAAMEHINSRLATLEAHN